MIRKQKVQVEKKEGVTTSFFYLNFFIDTARCNNLEQAVRQANAEYMGQAIKKKEVKGLVFNWLDFWNNVPNELCWKHGFQKDCIEMPTLRVSYKDTELFNSICVA